MKNTMGVLVLLALCAFSGNPAAAKSPKALNTEQDQGDVLKESIHKLSDEKYSQCEKICYHAFRSLSWNPMSHLTSTKPAKKCKKLCKGRQIIWSMAYALKQAKKQKYDNKALKKAKVICLDFANEYLYKIYEWSLQQKCSKLKQKSKKSSLRSMMLGDESVNKCKKIGQKNKENYQKLVLNYCAGRMGKYNPIVYQLHERQKEYNKDEYGKDVRPLSMDELKKNILAFYKKYTKKNGQTPEQKLFDEDDIAGVITDDESEEKSQAEDEEDKDNENDDNNRSKTSSNKRLNKKKLNNDSSSNRDANEEDGDTDDEADDETYDESEEGSGSVGSKKRNKNLSSKREKFSDNEGEEEDDLEEGDS